MNQRAQIARDIRAEAGALELYEDRYDDGWRDAIEHAARIAEGNHTPTCERCANHDPRDRRDHGHYPTK